MNLVNDSWIPVIYENQESKKVSLKTLYEEAESIRDLAVNPPQRISLMRLLICITQAALDGPENEEAWFYCKPEIGPQSLAYLEQWQDRFDLYGDKPFLQVKDLVCDESKIKPTASLDTRLSSGNNATLFDHEAVHKAWPLDDVTDALNFLTYMNFSAGGKVGVGKWGKADFNHSTFAGPCLNVAQTFIKGQNVLMSLFFNLLSKKGQMNGIRRLPNLEWGKPVWELFPQSIDDAVAFENASKTYLGRLVPLSRFVKLGISDEKRKCILSPTQKEYKIDQLPAYRESSATVAMGKDDMLRYIRPSSDRHMWRQLGSVLTKNMASGKAQSAIALANLSIFYDNKTRENVDIWVGGLETGKTAGKIRDALEWVFNIPVAQLAEVNLNKYELGVSEANTGDFYLQIAIKAYCQELKMENTLASKGRMRYWSLLDAQYMTLQAVANDESASRKDHWHPILKKASHDAYAYSCPHETPRQIQAFAKGREKLKFMKFSS